MSRVQAKSLLLLSKIFFVPYLLVPQLISRDVAMKESIGKFFNRTTFIAVLLLPILHYGVIQVAHSLSFDENGVLVLWPSTGVYLAAILFFGYSVWPGILVSEIIVNPILYGSIPISIGLSFVDAVDPLLTAFLIKRFLDEKGFLDRIVDVLKFIGLLMVSPTLTSNIGITLLCFAGFAKWQNFGAAWWAWWISLVIGMAVITPVIISWNRQFLTVSRHHAHWWLECLVILFSAGAISQVSFFQGYPVEYMLLPLLVWAAIRQDKRFVTLIILGISVYAILGTVHGTGSFVRASTGESLVLLQSFIGVITLTTLVISAATAENIQAKTRLREANDQLENRVEERTSELQETLKELKLAQSMMVQHEKMSSLGLLASGVAHEINNPVSFIHGNIAHAKSYISDLFELVSIYEKHCPELPSDLQSKVNDMEIDFIKEDANHLFQSMLSGTKRIQKIVLSFRSFSRLDETEYKSVDIHEGIESTLMILKSKLKGKTDSSGIEVVKDYGQLPLIECYVSQLNQVFMNLLNNAIDALNENIRQEKFKEQNPPTITIHTQLLDNDFISIHISDNGPGISEENLAKIFDPFFTTKKVGEGTGLGLSISYQIITERHNGKLYCNSSVAQGTKFTIEIPLCQSEPKPLTRANLNPVTPCRGSTAPVSVASPIPPSLCR